MEIKQEDLVKESHVSSRLGSIPVMPRLEALREDILSSRYHACTQKASLLTGYFREHIRTGFFDKGGMEVQFNIIDPSLLIEAKEHPEQYRGLVVLVSGYSAYFNDLTATMKDELIARTTHECGC